VYALIGAILLQAEEEAAEANDAADLYPHWEELVVGALAFAILFFFMWKWVFPRINTLLDERRVKI
jgi:F-type H+-transporting ATPase subunit b